MKTDWGCNNKDLHRSDKYVLVNNEKERGSKILMEHSLIVFRNEGQIALKTSVTLHYFVWFNWI